MSAIILCLALALSAGADSTVPSPLTVTYVGNTGFLVEAPGRKIAIDALLGGQPSVYYDIPDSVVALMKAAQPPFDNIDVIAVTHWHHDHFDAGIVAQHLKSDTRCVVLCPQQVADSLAARPEYGAISQRIHVIDIPVDSVASYSQAGISVRILSSRHGPYYDVDSNGKTVDIHRTTRNLEYLFTLGGRTVFHSGDAAFEDKYRYQVIGLGKDSIDIAFVPAWGCHDQQSFTENMVRECLLPRWVFFTHLAPGKGAQLARGPLCNSYRGVTFATHSLESWVIPAVAAGGDSRE